MKTFETFKELIIQLTFPTTTSDELKQAENWNELLAVVKNNIAPLCKEFGVNDEMLSNNVPDEILVQNQIYINKQNIIQREGLAIFFNSTSEHFDNAESWHFGKCSSKHYDNARSWHYDNVYSKHNGSVSSRHYDKADSSHFANSSSQHFDNATSRHYEYSTSLHFGTSQSIHFDRSFKIN